MRPPKYILSFIFLNLISTASSRPLEINEELFQNETLAGTLLVGYAEEPNVRGTASLVLSCVLTLILCVWSALHLNVPPPNDSNLNYCWTCARWIFAGIYAPELVVFTAWRQWSSARVLHKIVKNGQQSKRNTFKNPWTLTHSFFASTGGFAIEISSPTEKSVFGSYLPDTAPNKLTLTAHGVGLLASLGHLPDVPVEEIEDKSKGNDIAKFLVMLQAAWMLMQIIGRLAAKLPVTVLEVNTVAHVLCAFAMYGLWWKKPLMPNAPISISDDGIQDIVSFMYMSSKMSGAPYVRDQEAETIVKTLFAFLNLYSLTPELEQSCLIENDHLDLQYPDANDMEIRKASVRKSHTAPPAIRTISAATSNSGPSKLVSTVESIDLLFSFRPINNNCIQQGIKDKMQEIDSTAFFERRPRLKADHMLDEMRTQHPQRWQLAAQAVRNYPRIKETDVLTHPVIDGHCLHIPSKEYLVPYSKNWPSDELLRSVDGLVVGIILWLANFLYGAIHLAAWNDHFPTDAEKWLFRAGAIYIGFSGALWVILNSLVRASRRLNVFWERWMDGEKSLFSSLFLGTIVFICGLSLMFARGYIVLEAFLSVRELPVRAYLTPDWTELFPHF
ncbi:hypothetical protein ABW19_dt0209686 [Dactylella cylindrospora]|nr:hypothetical protein ABW19_dt0209686 [Dactylella cylindrospora]